MNMERDDLNEVNNLANSAAFDVASFPQSKANGMTRTGTGFKRKPIKVGAEYMRQSYNLVAQNGRQ